MENTIFQHPKNFPQAIAIAVARIPSAQVFGIATGMAFRDNQLEEGAMASKTNSSQ